MRRRNRFLEGLWLVPLVAFVVAFTFLTLASMGPDSGVLSDAAHRLARRAYDPNLSIWMNLLFGVIFGVIWGVIVGLLKKFIGWGEKDPPHYS